MGSFLDWPDVVPALSGPHRPPADVRGVYEQIADAAGRHASEIAVVHGDVTVTYDELINRVGQLCSRFEALDGGQTK